MDYLTRILENESTLTQLLKDVRKINDQPIITAANSAQMEHIFWHMEDLLKSNNILLPLIESNVNTTVRLLSKIKND